MFIKGLIIQSVMIDYIPHEHPKIEQGRETRNYFTNSVIFDVCQSFVNPMNHHYQ